MSESSRTKSSVRTKPRFGRRAKLVAAAISCVVALIACEAAVRISRLAPEVKPIWLSDDASPDVAYRRSSNPVLGYELKPNYRSAAPDDRSSYARINSHGQRDIEREIDAAPGTRRVILLGDSVVEGHGLPEIDQTISRQLEALYAEGNVEVLNLGISGYCTRSEVELLKTKGLRFQPDVVVLVFVENDFDNFSPQAFEMENATARPAFVKHLFVLSHLFRLTCIKLNWFQFGVEADPLRWSQQAIGQNNVVAGLEILRELAVEHSFQPMVAVWPNFSDSEIGDTHFMPGNGDDLIVERIARLYGLPTVRLSQWFQKHWESVGRHVNPRERYSVEGDHLHPTEEAAHIAAQALKSILAEMDAGRHALGEPEADDVDAIEAALSLGTKDPNYAMVYVNIGRDHEAEGDLEQAAKYYQMALDEDPQSFPAMNNLGVLFGRRGDLVQAAEFFRRALSERPNSPDSHNNLGNVLLAQRQMREAGTHFLEAIRIRPDYAEAHVNYASLLVQQTPPRVDEAESHIRRAIEIQPDYAKGHHNLGIMLARRGDFDGAAVQFRRAIEVDPQFAPSHSSLGHVFLKHNRFDDAASCYRRAIQIDPSLADAQQGLTQAEAQLRKSGKE